jgi:hypothetical protein
MYVDFSKSTVRGKIYTRHLVRESYREDGKVKHRTIANLSRCSSEEIEAIRLALRHKGNLADLGSVTEDLQTRQGQSVGAVWLLFELARQVGVAAALGTTRQGRLALWQVIARLIDQGSRLSAVRLATHHAACDVLGLEAFNEDDLYGNLDWLTDNQPDIETRLFRRRYRANPPQLFLYDVTSTYLEGMHNALGAFGYNRDGKKGKKQLVIGLLCDGEGAPLSIEVFRGNTTDPKTFVPQIRKVIERFGAQGVTFVGDRGMIKSEQIAALGEADMHFITAITKPQIETLLRQGTIQMELFDQPLAEVTTTGGERYVLRRNPTRAQETQAGRQDKLARVRRDVTEQNTYLCEHPRARVEVARRRVVERAQQLRIDPWVEVTADPEARRLAVTVDEDHLAEEAKLDGCYVIKTDLPPTVTDKETVHARYKDLALVEWAFRTSKTVELELRPVNVRLESRTRGHALVIMLAYLIARELARRWCEIDATVQEAIDQVGTLCTTEVLIKGRPRLNQIPHPRPSVARLLTAARVRLPKVLPWKGIQVATKRKLPTRRKKH